MDSLVTINVLEFYSNLHVFLSECISESEVGLLMESLPHNIKIDSAPFRQHLGSNMKKLLVRLRDSSLTLLKDPTANDEALSTSK